MPFYYLVEAISYLDKMQYIDKMRATVIMILFLIYGTLQVKAQNTSADSAKILMVGNSITYQGNWKKILGRTDITNWGIPGYTTEQLSWTIKNYTKLRPTVVFLEGGINDLTLGISPQRVFQNQVKVIDSLYAHHIIPVVQSTLYQNPSSDQNKKVKKVNKLIKKYCAAHGIDYLDINSVLSENGLLKKELTIDGTHLKQPAYLLWADIIKKELQKLKM